MKWWSKGGPRKFGVRVEPNSGWDRSKGGPSEQVVRGVPSKKVVGVGPRERGVEGNQKASLSDHAGGHEGPRSGELNGRVLNMYANKEGESVCE